MEADDDSLQKAIFEEIRLRPCDPSWAAAFALERDRLEALFPESFVAIEHIGSTAVAGLAAKPIIDILAGVRSLAEADALIGPICRSGYTTSTEFNATLPDSRWFMRSSGGHRTHHLHVAVHGSEFWSQRLRFRDALRANATLAAQYSQLKAALARKHRTDREAYTDAKSEFIRAAMENAYPPRTSR